MGDDLPDVGRFADAFTTFIERMNEAVERPESPLVVRLREHLGAEPEDVPVTSAELPGAEHPNLQLALDDVLVGAELLGYRSPHMGMGGPGFVEVIAAREYGWQLGLAPVSRTDVEVGDGRVIACVSAGVYLAEHEGAPVALTVTRASEHRGMGESSVIRLDGLSPAEGAASALIRELRAAMLVHNVYRGRVISLAADGVVFHQIAAVPRDQVILPEGTLERLERHAIGIAEQAEALESAGRHLKRGILLHGPPGTGKTLSVTYLLGAMPGRTCILLTGRGLGMIGYAVEIARALAPATVVLEDVDLVAAERTWDYGHGDVLFELLNQMEGVDDDADLLFLLTTNRPDVIEPALAARPGRVDLALEIPLPDADARRRLLDLYAAGMELDAAAAADVIARTEHVSGAFVRELARQATLRAALDGRDRATGQDLVATLDELLAERAALTRRLLGHHDGSASAAPPPSMLRAMSSAGLDVPAAYFDEA